MFVRTSAVCCLRCIILLIVGYTGTGWADVFARWLYNVVASCGNEWFPSGDLESWFNCPV